MLSPIPNPHRKGWLMADSLRLFSDDVRALRVSVDTLVAEIRRVCPPVVGLVEKQVAGSPADVLDRFFNALPEATPSTTAEPEPRLCVGLCAGSASDRF